MSTGSASLDAGALSARRPGVIGSRLRAYFFSDSGRTIQTVLGLIWLLDGGLQFQSFMYGNGFIEVLKSTDPGQPQWLISSVNWGANTLHGHQAVFNTLFALVQVAIGIGLLHRRSVRPALALSFVWALIVWWFGESFGMLFMNMANALTGAPGAVILYALVGALAWPGARPGGLLGLRAARLTWGGLWVLMGFMWLYPANSGSHSTTDLINAAPSGMSWLSTIQNDVASAARGDGFVIALVLAVASAAIGIAVARNWHARPFLIAAIVLNVAYWLFGQGLGGIFEGGATDPNAAPVFVLLAYAMYVLVPYEQPAGTIVRREPAGAMTKGVR